MKNVDYDERLHRVYSKGRALSKEATDSWLDAFASLLPTSRPLTLADVGCGTGRFTPHLADRFGDPVIGIEPSLKMLEIALAEAAHPRVTYLSGTAERPTCPDASVDAVLLFFVWHHVTDRIGAARELRRITRPGGTLLMRTELADHMPPPLVVRLLITGKRGRRIDVPDAERAPLGPLRGRVGVCGTDPRAIPGHRVATRLRRSFTATGDLNV